MINARLVPRHGSERLLRRGTGLAAIAGLALAVAAWTGWGGLAGLVGPLLLFIAAAGFIIANSIAGALAGFPDRAGAASALVGAIQYGSGILGSTLVGLLADGTPWPMGWVIAASGLGSYACARLLLAAGPPRRPGQAGAGSEAMSITKR